MFYREVRILWGKVKDETISKDECLAFINYWKDKQHRIIENPDGNYRPGEFEKAKGYEERLSRYYNERWS